MPIICVEQRMILDKILNYKPTVERTEDGRFIFVDVAKALTMFIVVLYHLDQCNRVWANAFFMPLFFFLSGIFFKPHNTGRDFIRRELRGTLLPFLVGIAAGLLVEVLFYHFQDSSYLGGKNCAYFTFNLVGNVPLWFLVALFFMQFIVWAIENSFKKVTIKMGTYLLFAAIGYLCSIFNLRNTAFFGNACLGLPFFVLGYYGKDYWLSGRWYSHLLLILSTFAMLMVIPLKVSNNFHHTIVSPYYFPTIFFALAGIYMVLGFSMLLANNFKCKWLIWIGESTIFVLIFHYLFVPQFRDVILPMIPAELKMTKLTAIILSVVLALVTTLIGRGVRRVIPFMFPPTKKRNQQPTRPTTANA